MIITGSNGFIGSNLIAKLKTIDKIDYIALNREFGDITDKKTFDKLPKSKTVIHLANKIYIPYSWSFTEDFIKTNILGTLNVLEYCKKYNSHLIFLSSYLYGNQENFPTNEDANIDY